MELKVLLKDQFTIATCTNRGKSIVEDELLDEEEDGTYAQRLSIHQKLSRISELGFEETNIWLKPLDTKRGVYEIKSGPIRVFCIRGNDGLLLICTSLLRKSTKKADKQEIDRAAELKKQYDEDYKNKDINFIGVDDD